VKPLKQELPLEDFEKIDHFFQSFAYQFRDKKTAYVRKLYIILYLDHSLYISKKLIDTAIITELKDKQKNRFKSSYLRSYRRLDISIELNQKL
jgi:hypothetical protein